MGLVISTAGDLGDATYLLTILHQLPGGPHTFLFQPSASTKSGADPARFIALFKPLADKQPYVAEFREWRASDRVDWESARFRTHGHYRKGDSLIGAHLRDLVATLNVGQSITGEGQWLFNIEPDVRMKGRVVVNRTERYRNPLFPWAEVVRHYRHRLVFVGLESEYRDFAKDFGYLDYIPTKNLLEVAQIVAGSLLFIGNQSCAGAIAEGMKHPRIQETCLYAPDCIYPGPWVQHVADGAVVLPGFDGEKTLVLPGKPLPVEKTVAQVAVEAKEVPQAPPGGWVYHAGAYGEICGVNLEKVARTAAKLMGVSADVVMAEMLKAGPKAFVKANGSPTASVPVTAGSQTANGFDYVVSALANAGIKTHPVIDKMAGNTQH